MPWLKFSDSNISPHSRSLSIQCARIWVHGIELHRQFLAEVNKCTLFKIATVQQPISPPHLPACVGFVWDYCCLLLSLYNTHERSTCVWTIFGREGTNFGCRFCPPGPIFTPDQNFCDRHQRSDECMQIHSTCTSSAYLGYISQKQ